jgi:hypothetical protein
MATARAGGPLGFSGQPLGFLAFLQQLLRRVTGAGQVVSTQGSSGAVHRISLEIMFLESFKKGKYISNKCRGQATHSQK